MSDIILHRRVFGCEGFFSVTRKDNFMGSFFLIKKKNENVFLLRRLPVLAIVRGGLSKVSDGGRIGKRTSIGEDAPD